METPLSTLGAVASRDQREALASPLRLEIFGHFTEAEPLSVRELAERMGRAASSLYYHVDRLADVGLLREAGERRRGTRAERVYEAAHSTLRLEPDGSAATRDALLRTMGAAFRMAERDLEAALRRRRFPGEGSGATPTFATRLHFRATPTELDEIRGHLRAALEVVEGLAGRPGGPESGAHYSLTLALLPLRGRERGTESE